MELSLPVHGLAVAQFNFGAAGLPAALGILMIEAGLQLDVAIGDRPGLAGGITARGHPLDHVVVRPALNHAGLVIEGGRRERLGLGAHRRQDIKPERECE